jgi:acylphosphatase
MAELRRYRIRGRVQGVGFRAFVWRTARDIGVDGWVRNRYDGSVEALVSADPVAHERLRKALEQGPRMSIVDHVEVTEDVTGEDVPRGFDVRHDA